MNLVTLKTADLTLVSELLEDELDAWRADLGWDYAPVRDILLSFIRQRALSGFVAIDRDRAAGYSYLLVQRRKGIIGTIYRRRTEVADGVTELLQQASIDALKNTSFIDRVESQIMPFRGISLEPGFLRNSFQCHARHFLQKDLTSYVSPPAAAVCRTAPWNVAHLTVASRVLLAGYGGQTDALICEDYQSEPGCERYLRSLLDTPGCGTFLPADSHVAFDDNGVLCGFILASRISTTGAAIPQISILPSHQGRGYGTALMNAALSGLTARGYKSVSLTVTAANRRAHDWYTRQEFRVRKAFSACIWQRA